MPLRALENCCCCINLESGTKHVAWTGLVLSSAFFVVNGILLNDFPFVNPELVVGIIVLGAGMGIIANCMLLLGLSQRIRQLLLVWLLTDLAQTGAAAALAAFWAQSSMEGPPKHLEMRVIMTIFAVVVAILFVHFWLVVFALYRRMGTEKKYLENILQRKELGVQKASSKNGLENIPAEKIVPGYTRDPSSAIEAQLW